MVLNCYNYIKNCGVGSLAHINGTSLPVLSHGCHLQMLKKHGPLVQLLPYKNP